MKWNRFDYQGEVYDLSHLHPFEWHVELQKTNDVQQRKYHFNVEFSMHCFTKGKAFHAAESTVGVDDSLLYKGPKESRIFCFERYELSKQLPGIIQSLDRRICWHTHHGSFFTIEVQTADGQKNEYEVYFDVFKSAKGWMTLMVKSAYVRDVNHGTTQPRKRRIRFSVIAINRFEGRKLHPPR